MKKKSYYAEESLIQKNYDVEAKDGNRNARDGAAFYSYYSVPFANDKNIGIISVNDGLNAEYGWWGVNYKALGASIEALEAAEDIEAIVLDINSPGGDVSGLFDLCEQIRNCEKPIYAYTSGNLASAAYTIASATDGIYATESANIGSVGVFMAFVDDSKYMEKMGLEEISFYGKNSDKKNLDPKSKEGKEVYQAEIDELEEILIKNIANYRGVTSDYVLENFGHGLMFRGQEALQRGMIDGVVSDFDQFIDQISADSTANGGKVMADNKKNDVVLATSVEGIDPALLEEIQAKAKAEALEEAQAQATEQAQIAVNAERERVAELNKYALLPNAEISAMAEQAKADGTSVEDFVKAFNAKAFEIISKAEAPKDDKVQALAEEAKESASVDTGSQMTNEVQGVEKSDLEKAKELAKKTNARITNK